MQQKEALAILKMGMNVFLTGAAGSGKTYLLNQYIHYLKENNINVAVTASTGIAATHIQGTTLHSWSGIGIKKTLSQTDKEKLLASKRIKRNYTKTNVLIIDEVSMLHPDQLDMVDSLARAIRNIPEMFGGMQIVLCGDFFQLPPITSNVGNKKQFAFEANAWQKGNIQICYLSEQHRQVNDPLLTILNDIRNGVAGEQTKIPLRTRYKKEPQGFAKATKLYSRNINVEAINEQELANLSGQEKTFIMKTDGFSMLVQSLKKNCLAPEKLKLKIHAEVMFVKNDVKSKYVNGTRCVVVGFDKKEGWPIVKTHDHSIITVSPTEWKFEENGSVRATLIQIPLCLAWAITIHKSQGMTLDTAEIDLGDAFEPGMGYVALSRIRTLNGLKLMNLNEMALKVHPDILQHDKILKENSSQAVKYLNSLGELEIENKQKITLLERFKPSARKKTTKKPKEELTHLITLKMLKEKMSIESIATKRGFSARTIIGHLEKLQNLKLMDDNFLAHLKENFSLSDFEVIYSEFKKSADGKLKPVYEKFEGKYSYDHLQLVRIFVIQAMIN